MSCPLVPGSPVRAQHPLPTLRCPKPGTEGAAAGGGGGGGGGGGHGQGGEGWTSFKQDWECQQCGDYQFARNARCRRCGADRPEVEGAEGEQAPKHERGQGGGHGLGGGGHGGGGGGGRREGRMNAKPGDWMCPVPNCNALQFARNTHCRRCGAPRPDGESGGGGDFQGGNFGGGGGGYAQGGGD